MPDGNPASSSRRAPCRRTPGYQGLAKAFPDQIHAPATQPSNYAPAEQIAVYEAARKQQSSRRICVEHATAEPKKWRSLQRWIERREYYAQTHLAVAGLASDRATSR